MMLIWPDQASTGTNQTPPKTATALRELHLDVRPLPFYAMLASLVNSSIP